MNRREFIEMAGGAGLFCASGCMSPVKPRVGCYSVAVLGDTHYDAEPESVYHSHYDESNKWAKVQHEEFRRNGEMWRERCPRLLEASAGLARRADTAFVLQLGDLIQGDCDDAATHKKMLDDCIKLLRKPYPAGLPFLTVVGNHDFRGKGARPAYFEFVEPFMAGEIAALCGAGTGNVRYPVFSFRFGEDRWVFCDFETKDLDGICDEIESDPVARHVFLVSHGPFTASADGWNYRWRLGGRAGSRDRLYETLSRRHAVVLSGHTHTTNFYRYENALGGFSEFTVNSVWDLKEGREASGPVESGPENYGKYGMAHLSAGTSEGYRRETDFFRRDMKEYFFSFAAGHCRLDVSGDSVSMSFYPGSSRSPAHVFPLVRRRA